MIKVKLNYSTKAYHGTIPLNGVCIPSLWVYFSIIGIPQNGHVLIFDTHIRA